MTMIERAARAVAAVPDVFVRTNKMREDGKVYEVGYIEGDLITDETIKISGAYAGQKQASEARDKLQSELRARAAIEALRDPTQGMRIVGHAALDASPSSEAGIGARVGFAALGDAWRAMIDDVLAER